MNQREMPLLSELRLRPKQEAPVQLVVQCNNYREAVLLCMQLGGYSQAQIAERLGMAKGTLNQILNRGGSEKRARYLDPDMFEAIEDICGNRAIAQYFQMQSQGLLNRQNTGDRIAALRRELAELEASTQKLGETECPNSPPTHYQQHANYR